MVIRLLDRAWGLHLRKAPIASLLALAGCSSPSTSESYASALGAETYDAAHTHCVAISEEPTRSDCLVAISERHEQAISVCAEVAVDTWAQECRFQFAERAAKAGDLESAFAACDSTQRFGRECSYHLIREVARTVIDRPPAEVGDRAAPYAKLTRAPDAERLFWKAYFRERLASGVAIDPTGCPTPRCFEGAREEMQVHLPNLRKARPDFCTADVTTLTDTLWVENEQTIRWAGDWQRAECSGGRRPR